MPEASADGGLPFAPWVTKTTIAIRRDRDLLSRHAYHP
jgi:hypothetical protein